MSLIDDDKLEEFNNAISARGLSADDFELTKHDEPMHGVEVQPLG